MDLCHSILPMFLLCSSCPSLLHTDAWAYPTLNHKDLLPDPQNRRHLVVPLHIQMPERGAPSPLHVRNSCLSCQAQLNVTSSGKSFLTVPWGRVSGGTVPYLWSWYSASHIARIHALPGLGSLAQAPVLRALFTELD